MADPMAPLSTLAASARALPPRPKDSAAKAQERSSGAEPQERSLRSGASGSAASGAEPQERSLRSRAHGQSRESRRQIRPERRRASTLKAPDPASSAWAPHGRPATSAPPPSPRSPQPRHVRFVLNVRSARFPYRDRLSVPVRNEGA